jgi:hypothetical protein
MKTLDEIDAKLEKRTPISSLPLTISASGSYYLTGNLAVATGTAITINADNVTVDLNGFTISSSASPANSTGILINGLRRDVTIKNGHILGTTTFSGGTFTSGGFVGGIASLNTTSTNLRISEVSVAGIGGTCIDLSASTRNMVDRCTVSVCSTSGIVAGRVYNCDADTTGSDAIVANSAVNCFAQTVGTSTSNDGIVATSVADNCVGIAVAGLGVSGSNQVTNSSGTSTSGTALSGKAVNNSTGSSTSGSGLSATECAINSSGTSSSNVGLVAPVATNCFGTSTTGATGMTVAGTASFCRGRRDGGFAISAGIAIGCTVSGTGTISSANKFLGTP